MDKLDYREADIEIPDEVFELDVETRLLAKDCGIPLSHMYLLSRARSPRNITQSKIEWAQFATFAFREYVRITGYKSVNIRSLHYFTERTHLFIIPGGKTYANTDAHWIKLQEAIKWARYLGLLDYSDIDDHWSPKPSLFAEPQPDSERESISADEIEQYFHWALGSGIVGNTYAPHGDSPYLVIMYTEKAGMSPVVDPIARKYGINHFVGKGEATISACAKMAEEAAKYGKIVIILILSDYDIAGKSIAGAISAKMDYFLQTRPAHKVPPRVILKKILLTWEQVDRFALDPAPIKASDTRSAAWERREGRNTVVELNSLLGVPGAAETVIMEAVREVIDTDCVEGIARANERVRSEIANCVSALRPYLVRLATWTSALYKEIRPKYEPEREMQDIHIPDAPLYDSSWRYLVKLAKNAEFKKKRWLLVKLWDHISVEERALFTDPPTADELDTPPPIPRRKKMRR